jgi:hypothetical protein
MSHRERLTELKQAVRDFLDDMEECDENGDRLGWPTQLERLSEWNPKDGS